MRGCLDEHALLEIADGGGSRAECQHLAGCPRCGHEAARLGEDLARLRRILLEAPLPASPRRAPLHAALEQAAPLALALTMTIALAWGALATRADLVRLAAARAAPRPSPASLAGELSRALFAVEALDPVSWPRPRPVAPIGAALRGEHPCERSRTRCPW